MRRDPTSAAPPSVAGDGKRLADGAAYKWNAGLNARESMLVTPSALACASAPTSTSRDAAANVACACASAINRMLRWWSDGATDVVALPCSSVSEPSEMEDRASVSNRSARR